MRRPPATNPEPSRVDRDDGVESCHNCEERMAMGEKFLIVSGKTIPDFPVDRLLEDAIGELDEVVIIGTHKDGKEYFASSVADGPNVNWMLDRAKKALIEIVDRD